MNKHIRGSFMDGHKGIMVKIDFFSSNFAFAFPVLMFNMGGVLCLFTSRFLNKNCIFKIKLVSDNTRNCIIM